MSMRILIPGILAVVMAFGMGPVAFASSSVPFNGSGTGTFSMTPTTVTVAGTGHFQHLGLTTIAATGAITGVSTCGGFTATEQDAYTAANGDAITLTISDVFCSTSAPGVFQVTGSFAVAGGTGRFADASGSGTIEGSAVFLTPTSGTFSESTTGTISY